MDDLTPRQREILDYIHRHIRENGYPPTVREIGAIFAIRSTNGVVDHLKSLERKGHLKRASLKSRALRPLDPVPMPAAPEVSHPSATVHSLADRREQLVARVRDGVEDAGMPDVLRLVDVPLVGRVAAGMPALAEEQSGESVQIDSFLLGGHKRVFALRVKGDSMIDDGIFDGDYIFVKKQIHADPGEIVVALIENEATVKRFFPEGDRVRFQPANPRMAPIFVRRDEFRETMILGIVIGVYRKLT